MPKMHVEEVLAQLNQIREQQGDLAFSKARDAIIGMLIHQPRGEDFLKKAFPDVDLEPYKEQDTPNQMLELLKAQTPHLKNDIQLKLLLAGNEAYLLAMDCLFAGDKDAAKKAMNAVLDVWDMAEKSVVLGDKVAEIPAEERTQTATAFVEPREPESDVFTRLMAELTAVSSGAQLAEWYSNKRSDLDKVVDYRLRNAIFDQIRAKKEDFGI